VNKAITIQIECLRLFFQSFSMLSGASSSLRRASGLPSILSSIQVYQSVQAVWKQKKPHQTREATEVAANSVIAAISSTSDNIQMSCGSTMMSKK